MIKAKAPWAAIVLSGGRARRLGGSPKHAVRIGGITLLDRTLAAVAEASEVLIVGEAPEIEAVEVIRENPPFAGPAAAIGAALPHLESPWVTVVACDHPFIAEAIETLMSSDIDDVEGAIAVDATGRRQNLLFTVRRSALDDAVKAQASLVDLAVHDLLDRLDLAEVEVSERSLLDVDTWDDHAQLEDINARSD